MGITAQQIHDELKKGGVVVHMKNAYILLIECNK